MKLLSTNITINFFFLNYFQIKIKNKKFNVVWNFSPNLLSYVFIGFIKNFKTSLKTTYLIVLFIIKNFKTYEVKCLVKLSIYYLMT